MNDAEIGVITTVLSALQTLDSTGALRVLDYVRQRVILDPAMRTLFSEMKARANEIRVEQEKLLALRRGDPPEPGEPHPND